jgi:transcriptional regulator with XRE-family HTH domain
MDINKTGQYIAALRKSRGFTQQEVAQRLGITDKTISKWECGKGYPDITIVPVLAELFEVTSDELLSGGKICKDENSDGFNNRKIQTAYLLRSKRHVINNMLVCSAGCSIAAIVALFSLGQSTFNAPISCGASVLLCIISVIIAIVAFSKAKLVAEDDELKKRFPSELRAFCLSVINSVRISLLLIVYPLVMNVILWIPAYKKGGFLTVSTLRDPLYSTIAVVMAAIVCFASKRLLMELLVCGTTKPDKL